MLIVGLNGIRGSGKSTVAKILTDTYGFQEIAFGDYLKSFVGSIFSISDSLLFGPSALRDVPYMPAAGMAFWLNAVSEVCKRAPFIASMFPSDLGAVAVMDLVRVILRLEDESWSTPITIRKLLQTIGTDWGVKHYPNLWVDVVFDRMRKMKTGAWSYDPTKGLTSRAAIKTPVGFVISDCRQSHEIDAVHAAGGIVLRVRAEDRLGRVGGEHASEPTEKMSRFDAVINNSGPIEVLELEVADAVKRYLR